MLFKNMPITPWKTFMGSIISPQIPWWEGVPLLSSDMAKTGCSSKGRKGGYRAVLIPGLPHGVGVSAGSFLSHLSPSFFPMLFSPPGSTSQFRTPDEVSPTDMAFFLVFILFCFVFFRPHPGPMEVPRLGVKSELQLPTPQPQKCQIRAESVI